MDRFKKKILAFFSMFFVLFGLLTSCATNEDKFTLAVGMEAAYPPFNWTENQKTDENVQIKGKNNEYTILRLPNSSQRTIIGIWK